MTDVLYCKIIREVVNFEVESRPKMLPYQVSSCVSPRTSHDLLMNPRNILVFCIYESLSK
jgi:hypothetical protein